MIDVHIAKTFPSSGPESKGFHLAVEFEAQPGVTILYGPSGSGKTLTLDAIAGFTRPDSGRILLDDRILFDAGAKFSIPPRDRNCGYVFQSHALFPHMTVAENLAFAAHRLPRLERHRRITELLERFYLSELAGRHPRELSGGQKQRASIARALIAQPRILLFDEPARGLDTELKSDLHDLILELKRTLNIPILLVTHDFDESLALGDRVLIYQDGTIIRRGTPLELLTNPGSTTVAKLVGGFNIYEAEVLALDPARHTSRIRIANQDLQGPHLRGCFKGDRVTLCNRPEDMRLVDRPGDNRIRVTALTATERPQSIRVDFGTHFIADIPRDHWATARETSPIWLHLPPDSLRQL